MNKSQESRDQERGDTRFARDGGKQWSVLVAQGQTLGPDGLTYTAVHHRQWTGEARNVVPSWTHHDPTKVTRVVTPRPIRLCACNQQSHKAPKP